MGLGDRYDSEGVLAEGPVRYRTDEKVVCDPWPASISEIETTLGTSSAQRRSLFWHLVGFFSWFERALSGDRDREVWVRGRFASTLAPDVDQLDLVVHYDGRQLAPGDRWVLMALTAQPLDLYPSRLDVRPLRHDDAEYPFVRDLEAVRSRVCTLRPGTKEQVVAGWLRVVGEKGDG